MSLLRVRAYMESPVATTEEIHLDGIVLWAHPDLRGSYVTRSTPVTELRYPPISIHRLRVGGMGVYLSSSWIVPSGRGGRERFCKRRDAADMDCMVGAYRPGSGPGKHYCLPIFTVETPIVEWLVVARRRGLLELLRYVEQIGTYRRQGYGRVSRWEVEHVAGDPRDVLIDSDGNARRFLPASWTHAGLADDHGPVVPPYWHVGLRIERVRPGTPCELTDDVAREVRRCK